MRSERARGFRDLGFRVSGLYSIIQGLGLQSFFEGSLKMFMRSTVYTGSQASAWARVLGVLGV